MAELRGSNEAAAGVQPDTLRRALADELLHQTFADRAVALLASTPAMTSSNGHLPHGAGHQLTYPRYQLDKESQ
jgi:hypothetical protein